MMHLKMNPSIIVKTIFGIETHTLQKMIVTADKNRIFILKINNFKIFNDMVSTNIATNLIIHCRLFYCRQGIRNETRARKNKFNLKHSHHLFFLILRIKKIFTWFVLRGKIEKLIPINRKVNFAFFLWIEKNGKLWICDLAQLQEIDEK